MDSATQWATHAENLRAFAADARLFGAWVGADAEPVAANAEALADDCDTIASAL